MGVKFFGQFLIEEGEIDAAQLRDALDLTDSKNIGLGQFAVEKAAIKQTDLHRIQLEQRQKDVSFENLVVQLGLLSSDEVEALVQEHQACRLKIGDALVQKGYLAADRLGELLERFKVDQERYLAGEVDLPKDISAQSLAAHMVDLLPKFTDRLAEIQVKVGESELANGQDMPEHSAAVTIRMDGGLMVRLAGDEDFAKRLTAGMLGAPMEEINPFLLDDGLGEFLNVLAGNAVAILEQQGKAAEFDPPHLGGQAVASEGYVFPLVATHGKATLILENVA